MSLYLCCQHKLYQLHKLHKLYQPISYIQFTNYKSCIKYIKQISYISCISCISSSSFTSYIKITNWTTSKSTIITNKPISIKKSIEGNLVQWHSVRLAATSTNFGHFKPKICWNHRKARNYNMTNIVCKCLLFHITKKDIRAIRLTFI